MKLYNFVIYHQIGKFLAQCVLSPVWLKEIMGTCSPISNAPNAQPHREHDSPVTKPGCEQDVIQAAYSGLWPWKYTGHCTLGLHAQWLGVLPFLRVLRRCEGCSPTGFCRAGQDKCPVTRSLKLCFQSPHVC